MRFCIVKRYVYIIQEEILPSPRRIFKEFIKKMILAIITNRIYRIKSEHSVTETENRTLITVLYSLNGYYDINIKELIFDKSKKVTNRKLAISGWERFNGLDKQ
jgi:hypothetical protein